MAYTTGMLGIKPAVFAATYRIKSVRSQYRTLQNTRNNVNCQL